ncbi:MAG: primosomal protein N' [Planctomycetia bacterium]|nr:primosomal protein N' [Planctomycetia bacterium]
MKAEQQSLFELNPAPWEEDDSREQLVATVVFATGPVRPFDYFVPPELRGQVVAGGRVRAPFGKRDRLVTGYCVRLENRLAGTRRLKPLDSIVDRQSLLSPSMLRLTEWMADYYLCNWGQVLEAVVPAGVRGRAGTRQTQFVSLPNHVVARLTELKLTPTQQRIMNFLAGCRQAVPIREVVAAACCTVGPIQTLCKKGLIVTEIQRFDAGQQIEPIAYEPEAHLTLNVDQQQALDAILSSLQSLSHATILVHGVTGSGKTEVYIQAIQEVLRFGRQAIVLVPEISLTPQTESRFRSRFGNVAVMHSHQSDTERRRHWEQIAAGRVSVVVGARSAVFAPTPNLGLIVLDEEHETSFKQETAPRYNARDVALERARAERIPLVLGSATPSLESWHRAQTGQYHLVSLPKRVFDRPLPSVGTIDLRIEYRDRRSRGAISRQLSLAMDTTLKEGGQIILLLNRRGYSTHIQCPACGLVLECPHCAIALTHHLHQQVAICHYCDHQVAAPGECPECHFAGIRYSGLGTQRLEAEVKARFPEHRCLRMDTDTMQKPGSHEKALGLFRDGEVRILVGTQMIAKGLDFPNVTLVGVINADTALHLPDFRAAERTFQLVTQVAGRTGRGEKGGRVLVQTFNPEHVAITAAVRHDFEMFARGELPIRQSRDYPPFANMIRLVVRGPAERPTGLFADELALRLRAVLEKAEFHWRVLGPAPAPIAKLRGNFRFQIQTQAANAAGLGQAVRQATGELKSADGIQWIADVDPLDML